MPFKPAFDWISANPEDDEEQPRRLPPARNRTRPVPPIETSETHLEERDDKPSEHSPVEANEESGVASRDPAYEVGYGKPPVTTRFKPGQSGNPNGRPKGAKGLNTIVRETLSGKLTVRTPEGTKKISKIEAVLQKTLEKALKGDARAQFELMKLWRVAVPDAPEAADLEGTGERLSSADLAILAAFEAQLTERAGVKP